MHVLDLRRWLSEHGIDQNTAMSRAIIFASHPNESACLRATAVTASVQQYRDSAEDTPSANIPSLVRS